MCGLIAIYDHARPFSLPNISALSDSLKHRGPDGFNYTYNPHLFMGHSRLQIESSDTDHQPIKSLDGNVAVIVNGELYPYQELKRELQYKGYCFQTDSDSELVLALYQYYGEKFVEYLRGEFSCVLWDAKRQLLFAVRDRFGIKPLHYAKLNGRWYLGSEAKVLIAAGYRAQWSRRGLLQSFSHQYLTPGDSLFSGVRQIPPGCYLKIENGKSLLKPYYVINYGELDPTNVPIDIAVQRVKTLLIESVQMRIPTREKCAFSLSGGLDSSAIVSIATGFLDYSPDCYTVSFDHDDYDEYSLVNNLALEKPIHLHKVTVTSDDVINGLDDAAYFSEGLACNGQYVAKYLLNRAIAQDGYRVVMSGEGADEAFMGYAHLHHDYLCHEEFLNNKTTNEVAIRALLDANTLQSGLMLGGENITNKIANNNYIPSFLQAKFTFCQAFSELFYRGLFESNAQLKEQKKLLALIDNSLPKTFRSNKIWVQLVLANYILKTLGDGMEMAFSIEARLPFLDHKLFDYAASLPMHYKLSALETKTLLRKSLKGLVPECVRVRKKHPFIAPPIASTLSASGFDRIMDKLHSRSFRDNPVFDQKAVLSWIKQWRTQSNTGTDKSDPTLLMLLSFAALQEQFQMSSIE